jgi:hypothetical protein
VTAVADRPLRWFLSFLTLCAGFAAVSLVIYRHWFKHGPVLTVAYLVLVAVAVTWSCSRAWRIGLYTDDRGVTVGNYFRTHRFGWAEVCRFENGTIYEAEGGSIWGVRVVLRDGRAVTATGTAGAMGSKAKMTAIRQAAKNHGIPVDVAPVDLTRIIQRRRLGLNAGSGYVTASRPCFARFYSRLRPVAQTGAPSPGLRPVSDTCFPPSSSIGAESWRVVVGSRFGEADRMRRDRRERPRRGGREWDN